MTAEWWEEDDAPQSFSQIRGSDSAAEIKALREEVAALRGAIGEALAGGAEDASTVAAIAENRREAQRRAEQEARAVAAANDPSTIEKLRAINDPAEFDRFMRENGMGTGLVG